MRPESLGGLVEALFGPDHPYTDLFNSRRTNMETTAKTIMADGTVDDGKVYDVGGFPSCAGNDPNHVCRDIDVEIRSYSRYGEGDRITPRSLPTGMQPVETFLVTTLTKDDNEGRSPLERLRTAVYMAEERGPKRLKLTQAEKDALYKGLLVNYQVPKFEHVSRLEMLALNGYQAKTSLFFQTIHECFSEHFPLALSPEVLMYLVLHEVAVCVKQNPEDYRHLFTTTAEKQLIHVLHDGLREGQPSPWDEVLGLFNVGLADRVPKGLMEHALPSFSTHTVETQATSLVAFMDAASPFYTFKCSTCCGIPKIRLLGQTEDYKKLLNACAALSEQFSKHLGLYFTHLLPVLRKISEQAAGAPVDHDFWKSIYKHLSGSGTDAMSGWITAFLNYECENGKFAQKHTEYFDTMKERGGWPRGYDRDSAPCHLNRVAFIWNYFGTEKPMEFIGGIMGRDNLDGFVTPRLGFAIAHKEG